MSMHIVFMVSKYTIYVLADFCDQIPLMVYFVTYSSVKNCSKFDLITCRYFEISPLGQTAVVIGTAIHMLW